MGTFSMKISISLISLLINISSGQFMGYPYDYSSMFSEYTGYNPMMGMNGFGGMGTGMTGMESLYGAGQQFGTYNPYGNGMFNFANNGLFGQNAFGTGFNNNLFGGQVAGQQNGLNVVQQPVQPIQQAQNSGMFQNSFQSNGAVNDGNTMRAYGRRTQNFNNNNQNQNFAPTRVGQQGCNGFGCQQGWINKKV